MVALMSIVMGIQAQIKSLKLINNQLCTNDNLPIQLRGWSTHGSWYKQCYDDKGDFQLMKNNGANVARIVQYVNQGDGVNKSWVKNCIDWTADLGMYCIVDWHVQDPGNPNDNSYQAYSGFFNEISAYVKQKGYHHVLYEICNEPNEDTEGEPAKFSNVWGWVKTYTTKVLPVIKANDPNAIVIVGTPQWDIALNFPIQDPLDEMGMNVMYSFHIGMGNQQSYLGMLSAASAFIPVIVTEWSLGSLDGYGSGVNTYGGNWLMSVYNGKNLGGKLISWCCWSWSDKSGDVNSAFTSYGNDTQSWSTSGNYVKTQLAQGEERIAYCQSTPYLNTPQVLTGTETFYLDLGRYDAGNVYEACWDYDPYWMYLPGNIVNNDNNEHPANGGSAGFDDFRPNDPVDINYANSSNPSESYYAIGYIVAGEWVNYTIDVKKAGDYEFELYTNNHNGYNITAFSVDGHNALVDQNGNETYLAIKLKACNGGDEYDGYDTWGWTEPYSPYAPSGTKFFLRFPKTGLHKLGIAFLTSGSGLGSLRMNWVQPSISTDISESSGLRESVKGQRDERYNLSGQRVGKDYKGIVIHNGKKVVR